MTTKKGTEVAKKTTKPVSRKKTKKPTRKKTGNKRLSDKQRMLVLAKYEKLLAGGMKAPQAAKKVGFSYITLLAWRKKLGKSSAAKPARKPSRKPGRSGKTTQRKKAARKLTRRAGRKKTTTSRSSTQSIVLVTPSGYRIEGISPKDLTKIMKALG